MSGNRNGPPFRVTRPAPDSPTRAEADAFIMPDGPVAGADPVALSRAFQLLLLDRSNERDQYMDRILRAELRGYQHGIEDGYEHGWLAAIAELKRAQQETYELIRDRAPLWGAHYKTMRDGAR